LSGVRDSAGDLIYQSLTPQANFGKFIMKLRRRSPAVYDFMEKEIEFLIPLVASGSIDDKTAIKILKLLKQGAFDAYLSRVDSVNSSPGPQISPQSGGADARLTIFSKNLGGFESVSYGGSGDEFVRGIASRSQGVIYVIGTTSSRDLPTVNPIQSAHGGALRDTFIAAFDADSMQVIFATYLGGSGADSISGVAVDEQGNIYVAGSTESIDFPVTPGALQSNYASNVDAFIAKIGGVSIPDGPDFSLGFDQPTVTANRPSKVKLRVNINRAGGFGGSVTVTIQ
jgi:hypothetical protein